VIANPPVALSPRLCQLVTRLREEWCGLDETIHDIDQEIATLA
jgi:hypothetical protein